MATPLFRQGASPNAKLFFYAVASVCLIAVDSRVRTLEPLRQGLSVALYPLQQAMLLPRAGWDSISTWFEDQGDLSRRVGTLERQASQAAILSQQYQGVSSENEQLRQLLNLRQRQEFKTMAADILYETREPITRKVVIDRGQLHNLTTGLPVMDSQGLLGQLVRVFPLVSEVNLIVDKDQATPVQVARNGLRAVAYGGVEGGLLEIRYMAGNADIAVGDELYTSGLDGVYPANLPVAKVLQINRSTTLGFAKIICQPLAGVTRNRHVSVITSKPALPPAPDALLLDDKKKGKKKPAANLPPTPAPSAVVPSISAPNPTPAITPATAPVRSTP
jgi:rod shape-determining protein MreC